MSALYGLLFALGTAVIAITGDTLIKVAADREILHSRPMMAGILLYAASAVFWYFAMRHITLGQAAVAYSMLTLVALCLIGAFAFGEPIGLREGAGISLALAAMWLMTTEV